MKAFVYSVMLYSGVSSRGYFITSDENACLQCDIVFEGQTSCIWMLVKNPQKKTKSRGKVSEKTTFGVGMELQTVLKHGGNENPTPPQNDAGLQCMHAGLQLVSLVHLVM